MLGVDVSLVESLVSRWDPLMADELLELAALNGVPVEQWKGVEADRVTSSQQAQELRALCVKLRPNASRFATRAKRRNVSICSVGTQTRVWVPTVGLHPVSAFSLAVHSFQGGRGPTPLDFSFRN
eukprot:COSAG03_NODE_1340_length_4294_cov_90.195471_5_plen_125_part_00